MRASVQGETRTLTIEEKLKKLATTFTETMLGHTWPGEKKMMIGRSLPVFQAVQLLSRAAEIYIRVAEAKEQLGRIQEALSPTNFPSEAGVEEAVTRGPDLVLEKIV